MKNKTASSTPSDVLGRRVSDASGTSCRLQGPPDPLDDPGDVSCSTPRSCSRTGSPHATAVDLGSPELDPEVDFSHLKRRIKGQAASRELYNSSEYTSLAEARSHLRRDELDETLPMKPPEPPTSGVGGYGGTERDVCIDDFREFGTRRGLIGAATDADPLSSTV